MLLIVICRLWDNFISLHGALVSHVELQIPMRQITKDHCICKFMLKFSPNRKVLWRLAHFNTKRSSKKKSKTSNSKSGNTKAVRTKKLDRNIIKKMKFSRENCSCFWVHSTKNVHKSDHRSRYLWITRSFLPTQKEDGKLTDIFVICINMLILCFIYPGSLSSTNSSRNSIEFFYVRHNCDKWV